MKKEILLYLLINAIYLQHIKTITLFWCDYNNWINMVIIDETNNFKCSYSIHNNVLVSSYSNDIILLDDTSCTDFYGKPLMVMIVPDKNNRIQL